MGNLAKILFVLGIFTFLSMFILPSSADSDAEGFKGMVITFFSADLLLAAAVILAIVCSVRKKRLGFATPFMIGGTVTVLLAQGLLFAMYVALTLVSGPEDNVAWHNATAEEQLAIYDDPALSYRFNRLPLGKHCHMRLGSNNLYYLRFDYQGNYEGERKIWPDYLVAAGITLDGKYLLFRWNHKNSGESFGIVSATQPRRDDLDIYNDRQTWENKCQQLGIVNPSSQLRSVGDWMDQTWDHLD